MVRRAEIPDHIVDSALRLAATDGWRRITLRDIAAEVGLSLAQVHAVHRSKSAILAAFVRRVDDAVLPEDDAEILAEPSRDRLFDLVMRRLDAMAPHKEGVAAVVRDLMVDPAWALCHAPTFMRSMDWMLEVAGLAAGGCRGRVRAAGLGAVYLATLRVWFTDDSPDMARTMATLDRQLRRVDALARAARRPRRAWAARGPEPDEAAPADA